MAIIATKSISAEDQWSDVFYLAGDGAGWQRRALISISGGSTVTIQHIDSDKTTVLGSKTLTESSVLEVPVGGNYKVGCATGDYVDATTVVVEQ